MAKKAVQQELDGMPAHSPLGLACMKLDDLREERKGLDHDIKIAMQDAAQEFIKSGKTEFTARGKKFKYIRRDTDTIRIKDVSKKTE